MPKMKTHKGAARRFEISSGGKVLRVKGPKSHLRRRKSIKVKRLFGAKVGTSPANSARIKKTLLPYGKP